MHTLFVGYYKMADKKYKHKRTLFIYSAL